MAGELYFCEVVGAGGGFLDFDGDGDLDIYLVQGQFLDERGKKPLYPPHGPLPLRDRLYRNDSVAGSGAVPSFTDVTESSGIDARGYGMGVAVGDVDNDGHPDLYVTNLGSNQLWRNLGDGRFEDVTEAAGCDDDRWSASAAFLDYDRDGWLDLFVTNYVDFRLDNNKECFTDTGGRDYCGPKSYAPVPDRLFHNRGDGTFEDVTVTSQVARTYGSGLGVVCADFDDDGWIDIYVANDGMENQLWRNLGNGKFEDIAVFSGCAMNADAGVEAGMGVDAADIDGDGDEDLIVTHLTHETNTVYINQGNAEFLDHSIATGLGMPSWNQTGFGAAWFDYDGDGLLDLLVVNGAVKGIARLQRAGDPFPLREPNQLFRNLGGLRFAEVSGSAGAALAHVEVSRGAVFGDVDNDGDLDVLITNNSGPPRLLLNQVGNSHRWIGMRLAGGAGRRDMLGARVMVELASGRITRRARSDGSFLSASDPRVLVGLGGAPRVERVVVAWPDGSAEEWPELAIGHWHELVQGSGRPVPAGTLRDSGKETSPDSGKETSPVVVRNPEVPDASSDPAVEPVRVEIPYPALDRHEAGLVAKVQEGRKRIERLGSASSEDALEAYLALGKLFHAHAFWDAARACYHNATTLAPRKHAPLYLLACVEEHRGEIEPARAALERALLACPDDVPTLVRLGRNRFTASRSQTAQELYRRALSRDPSCGAAHYGLAQVAMSEGRFEEAARGFRSALDALPHASEIHYPLSQALRQAGEADRARAHLERRGTVPVTLPEPLLAELAGLREGFRPHLLAGSRLIKDGKLPAAEVELRKALSRSPDHIAVRVNLGLVLALQNQLEAALEQLHEALRIEPDNAEAHLNVGAIHSRLGRDEDALGHYRAALERSPRSPNPALNLGHALRRLGRHEDALLAYDEALRRDPIHHDALVSKALTCLRLHRYRAALDTLEAARKALPEDAEIAHIQARVLATAPEDGVRDGPRALRLMRRVGQQPEGRTLERGMTLAMALAECGHFPAAVRAQELLSKSATTEGDAEQQARIAVHLDRYRNGRSCREPWPDEHPTLSPRRLTPGAITVAPGQRGWSVFTDN